jgi:NitT/TauT family transport system ATP-binding protein
VTDAALTVENVAKVFRTRGRPPTVALADVSLEVRRGEFLVLLGASGCGKTTLLRLLAGLEQPTRGTVRLFGQPVRGPTAQAAMVFQNPVLLPWRTVFENVMLPVQIRRKKRSDWRERARSLLETTGLGEFADHYPRELSGGMRQRAAICRALVLDPPILFMDEPFGALDAITRAAMNKDLYETWTAMGKTIVFVTHDINEAVRLASRVVVMTPRPGRVARIIEIDIEATTYADRINSAQYLHHLRELQREVEVTTAGRELEEAEQPDADGDRPLPQKVIGI